jgi:hypothetical protein
MRARPSRYAKAARRWPVAHGRLLTLLDTCLEGTFAPLAHVIFFTLEVSIYPPLNMIASAGDATNATCVPKNARA